MRCDVAGCQLFEVWRPLAGNMQVILGLSLSLDESAHSRRSNKSKYLQEIKPVCSDAELMLWYTEIGWAPVRNLRFADSFRRTSTRLHGWTWEGIGVVVLPQDSC
jgi:hypothetical protein